MVPISRGTSVWRFLTVSMEAKDNVTHGRGSEFSRWGRSHWWFELKRRWRRPIFSLCNFVMYCTRRACLTTLTINIL